MIRPNCSVVILLLLPFLYHSPSTARRPIHGGEDGHRGDFALDLNSSTFDAFFETSPARFAVVEFFAKWCPACRNYKPQYEKIARIFNGPDAVHPGLVVMTRVDCAIKMNTKLCNRFSVSHYPMLFWAPPSKFAYSHWDPKQEKKEMKPIDDARTAERFLNWINKQLGRFARYLKYYANYTKDIEEPIWMCSVSNTMRVGPLEVTFCELVIRSSFSLVDEKYENENTLPYNASDPQEIARAIYDVEEATQIAFDIIIEHKMIKPETHSPLIQFLQLLVAHHPSKRCRRGSSEMLVNFDDLWPSDVVAVTSAESVVYRENNSVETLKICGKEIPRGYWIFCRGSKKDTRGFSCGLWILLHSLSVRVRDGESHLTFTAICHFIHNFFICDECRQHFYETCSRVNLLPNTTRDLSIWLWNAHNEVNLRLMKEEENMGTGDSKFPKVIWPTEQLCPSCYTSHSRKGNSTSQVEWNKDEVFNFLVRYYRTMHVSSYKVSSKEVDKSGDEDMDDSINAIPLGTALSIAIASCLFGAVACFWRAKQKNRKYFHQLRALKNI